MEEGAEGPVGGGVQGDGKREGAVESSRAFCGRGVQSGGAGFPFLDGCREDRASCGSGRHGERGVGMGAPGTPGAGGGTKGGGGGAG